MRARRCNTSFGVGAGDEYGCTLPLPDSDVRALLDVPSLLATDPAPGFDRVLSLIAGLIPCSSASFNGLTLASKDYRYVVAASTGANPAASDPTSDPAASGDPSAASLTAPVDDYDRRRAGNDQPPPEQQVNVDRWGAADFYGWSLEKARMVGRRERHQLAQFLQEQRFKLD